MMYARERWRLDQVLGLKRDCDLKGSFGLCFDLVS